MRFIPSRAELHDLIARADSVARSAVCGFVRTVDDTRVAVLYVHRNGAGEYVIPRADLPPAMLPAMPSAWTVCSFVSCNEAETPRVEPSTPSTAVG